MSAMLRSLAVALGLLPLAEAACPTFTDPYRAEASPFGWPLTPAEWDFEHQECWAAKYPMCGGERQSPMDINLQLSSSECASQNELAGQPGSLRGSYIPVSGFPAVTVSEYMRSVAVSGDFGSLTLKDAEGNDVEYVAEQVHLMVGSLHSINGTFADGEMLVIHRAKVAGAALPNHVVVSMLFREGSSGSSIFTELGLAETGEGAAGRSWRAPSIIYLNNALKEAMRGDFFSYSGSVPVPPCAESVHYVVLADMQHVAAAQLESLRSALSTHAGGFLKRQPVPRSAPSKECRSILKNRAEVSAPTIACTQHGSENVAACWAEKCDLSPVNLESDVAEVAQRQHDAKVTWDYEATSHVVVKPSKYSLDADGHFGRIMVNGRLFEAKKVSFKPLSQHTYDGQRYSAELVIEHHLFGDDFDHEQDGDEHDDEDDDEDEHEDEEHGPHVVMVSVPLKLGRESPLLRAFGIIEAHKAAIRDGHKYDVNEAIDLHALLEPSLSKAWYWYSGGPTTPGTCPAWGVKWLVFKEPLEVSLAQINYLHLPVSGFDSTLPQRAATSALLFKNSVPDDGAEPVGNCSMTTHLYDKTSCWKISAPLCGEGKGQSPINIDTASLAEVGTVRFLPKLSWKPVTGLRLSNNGAALGFDSRQLGYLTIVGADGFPKYYQAVKVEFRSPSEHMINGKQYAAELQIMHKKQNTVLDLDDSDVLFTSILFDMGEASKLMEQMLPEHLPHEHEHKTIEKPLDLMWGLGPAVNGPFFKYSGSFTSPGCEEVAQWVVFEKTMSISADQLEHFKELFPNPGNRPVQALNGRPVFKSTLQEPEQVKYRFFLNREMGRDRTAKTPPGMILWPILGTLTLCLTIMAGTFQREDPDIKNRSGGGLKGGEDDAELVNMIGRAS